MLGIEAKLNTQSGTFRLISYHVDIMSNLQTLLGTTKTYIEELKKGGIESMLDFLGYYPRTYESHNKGNSFSDLRGDQVNNFMARVCTKSSSPTKSGRKLFKCVIEDGTGALAECVWFTKPYFWDFLVEGKQVLFIGKAKLNFGRLQITSPKVEIGGESSIHSGDIVPVYSQIGEKLTSQWFREKMHIAIKHAKLFKKYLPDSVIESEDLMEKVESIRQIHFPDNQELLSRAREAIAFEELFFLQKDALERKEAIKSQGKNKDLSITMNVDLVKDFMGILKFKLTDAQRISLYQILQDMEKQFPMHRLLEGDVGSGKTLVALCAALVVLNSGKQVAFMVPTEVLARQHYNEVRKYVDLFSNSNKKYSDKFKPGLLIGALKPKEKKEVLDSLKSGDLNFLIGTHALISDNVFFANLGLAIIDEQHRFGVLQRERLQSNGMPHVLYMTATPIPRTLALVAYGDQDISVLNEMPKGRKLIHTSVVPPVGRHQSYKMIENEISKGRQAYVICPLVMESENLEVKAATEEFKRLKKEVFPSLKLSLIHGKLKSKEKEEVMNDFKKGEADILVSTSVVEVGVDVANATIMIIEGAERFGLAQLHQLRGRVGRSEHQSYCFLFTSDSRDQIDRLKALEKHNDGFALAEIDMKLRGAGEVYGLRQSGVPDMRMAALTDHKMVIRARRAAEDLLNLSNNSALND